MANTQPCPVNVTVKGTGIVVEAEAGVYEVWIDEDDCLGYVKGPAKKAFNVKNGKHDVFIFGGGRIVLRKTVTVGAEPEPDPEPQEDTSGTEYMNFGEAISAAKAHKRIQREGWNGKNQYVELAECISYTNAAGEIVNVNHEAIGNCAFAFVGTSGVQIGWLASQADRLADDWKIVRE